MDEDDLALLPVPVPRNGDALRQLWSAVLLHALQEAGQLFGVAGGCRATLGDSKTALRWLLADAHGVAAGGVGSFVWVCAVLDLDAGDVRRRFLGKCGLTAGQALQIAYGAPDLAA